jgi:hypothetical protein
MMVFIFFTHNLSAKLGRKISYTKSSVPAQQHPLLAKGGPGLAEDGAPSPLPAPGRPRRPRLRPSERPDGLLCDLCLCRRPVGCRHTHP